MVMAPESIARKSPHLSLIQNCMSSLNLISQSSVFLIHVVHRKKCYHTISYEIKNVYYFPPPNGNQGDDTSVNIHVHPDIPSKMDAGARLIVIPIHPYNQNPSYRGS